MRALAVAVVCLALAVGGCAAKRRPGRRRPGRPRQVTCRAGRRRCRWTRTSSVRTSTTATGRWSRARWVYAGTDEEGAHLRVVVTVTSVTRRVANGVTARVVRDTVTADGEIVEDTFDWYAQDDEGTVWYLGEDTAELEDGEITTVKAPSRPASTGRWPA